MSCVVKDHIGNNKFDYEHIQLNMCINQVSSNNCVYSSEYVCVKDKTKQETSSRSCPMNERTNMVITLCGCVLELNIRHNHSFNG